MLNDYTTTVIDQHGSAKINYAEFAYYDNQIHMNQKYSGLWAEYQQETSVLYVHILLGLLWISLSWVANLDN